MISLAIPRPELGNRAEARTKEVERGLKMGAEYILMLDLDQTVPEDGLEQFMRIIRVSGSFGLWDVLVIDAPNKDNPSTSNIYYHPDGTLAYFSISCCLIRASVFEKLAKPWFRSDIAWQNEREENGRLVWDVVDKYSDDNRGEDIYFSHKALEAGWNIIVLDDLKCAHFDLERL